MVIKEWISPLLLTKLLTVCSILLLSSMYKPFCWPFILIKNDVTIEVEPLKIKNKAILINGEAKKTDYYY